MEVLAESGLGESFLMLDLDADLALAEMKGLTDRIHEPISGTGLTDGAVHQDRDRSIGETGKKSV